MARSTGWVPNQHGAWAMMTVPFLAGVILRMRETSFAVQIVPLFVFWMVGYFAFHAASLWLKAPPKRRPTFVKPTLVHAGVSAVFGVVTFALAGVGIVGWAPFYLPLALPALWLAAQRNERATIGGALTIAAACLVTLVVRYDSPAALASDPDARTPLLVAALLFAYFFGTVLYVKTNLRERGNPTFYTASVAWHAGFTLVCLALTIALGWPWWWTAFAAVTLVRAIVVPRRRPMLTAKQIGIIESVLSVVVLVGIAVA